MDVDDRWMAELAKLKSAFLGHIDAGNDASKMALDAVISDFTAYVRVNQGFVKHTKENVALIDRWNDFVEAVRHGSDPNGPVKQLLDAIDEAIGATHSKTQPASPVTFNVGTATVVAGPGAHVHDVAVVQDFSSHVTHVDLSQLAGELARLRAAMRAEAKSLEEDAAVGAVAEAEKAAREGDRPRALERLKAAGKWALDVATKIGVEIATSALKTQLGLPK